MAIVFKMSKNRGEICAIFYVFMSHSAKEGFVSPHKYPLLFSRKIDYYFAGIHVFLHRRKPFSLFPSGKFFLYLIFLFHAIIASVS